MESLRVVFDTNVFHGAAFEALEASPFRALSRIGRIVPIYGHVMFEECLRAYASAQRRELLLDRWLPLIFDTTPSICKDWPQTWKEELVEGRGRKFSPFMRRKDFARVKTSVQNAPRDGSWHVYAEAKPELELALQKRADQKRLLVDFRNEVARNRKHRSNPTTPVSHLLKDFGPGLIARYVMCRNPGNAADRWLRDPAQYPFFTQFVLNLIYLANFSAVENTRPLDINAQADLDVMTHLIHGDVLVSNELGFLKHAFDDLWGPAGKVLMSSDEFVEHLRRLA